MEKAIKQLMEKAIKQSLIYGTGIIKTGIRKWYNPLRYIKGKIYQKAITLREVFK